MQELLEVIRRNVQLEARLIDDLLDLARIRNNKLQLHLEWVDAHDLLRRAIQICEPDIALQKLDVRLDTQAKFSCIEADSARIQQIFWNLISNAVKFSGAGAAIAITTFDDPEAECLGVEISDTGLGINPAHLERIFDAFEQAHGDRSKGLGLGLAISRVITELHGGTIEAKSEGEGKGSVFTVRLPRPMQKPEKPGSAVAPESPVSSVLRILLVEDHPDTAASLQRLLVRKGHMVKSANSYGEALKLIGQFPFDVLLTDIGLPDGRGLDLMEPFTKAAQKTSRGRDCIERIRHAGGRGEKPGRRIPEPPDEADRFPEPAKMPAGSD